VGKLVYNEVHDEFVICTLLFGEELPPCELRTTLSPLQTLFDHHPQLQAEIREVPPDPKPLAEVIVPLFKAILDEMKSASV
jgi:hypothetical protein